MKKVFSILMSFSLLALMVPAASADHTWGTYHWARTSNPFTLSVGDNVSGNWDANLAAAAFDWSQSSVLDTNIVPGSANPKNCKPTPGKVQACNSKYGRNGWLGVAQIWITGGEHITQGVVKLNDTYFNTAKYNTHEWRQLVVCQELAHTIGLDHQDEDFSNPNLGSCMDYTNDPSTNQHPNAHDFEQLDSIYAHLDATTTVAQTSQSSSPQDDSGDDWGHGIGKSKNGHEEVFVKDLGSGRKLVTHVLWA